MLKLNPVAQATTIALLPEMTDIERAAAEKMPVRDATREVAKHLQADLEAALQAAIEQYLGAPITDPEILRGRLTNVTVEGQEGETYCVDGVPVLWVGPVNMVREGDTIRGERQLQQLVA